MYILGSSRFHRAGSRTVVLRPFGQEALEENQRKEDWMVLENVYNLNHVTHSPNEIIGKNWKSH